MENFLWSRRTILFITLLRLSSTQQNNDCRLLSLVDNLFIWRPCSKKKKYNNRQQQTSYISRFLIIKIGILQSLKWVVAIVVRFKNIRVKTARKLSPFIFQMRARVHFACHVSW